MDKSLSQDMADLTISRPQSCQVWLDFDGTLTRKDVLDELIKKYSVDDSWKIVEDKWQKGLIGSRQCLTEQFDLLRISQEQLHHALDSIQLDDGILPLLKLLEAHHVPVAILSDGTDVFIKWILDKHDITNIPIRANTVVHHDSKLKLHCPNNEKSCEVAAAHCKCKSIEVLGKAGRKNIYIGDGRSDLCPARKADYVFAKGNLAKCLEKESIRFFKYSSLNDVVEVLSRSWQDRGQRCTENYATECLYPQSD